MPKRTDLSLYALFSFAESLERTVLLFKELYTRTLLYFSISYKLSVLFVTLLIAFHINMGQVVAVALPAIASVVVAWINHLSKPPEKPLPMPEPKKQENGKFAAMIYKIRYRIR